MHPDPAPADRKRLDRLASWVAERLDEGDPVAAWAATVALEEASGSTWATNPQPPAAAIGRRFARAHRRLVVGVGPHPRNGAAPEEEDEMYQLRKDLEQVLEQERRTHALRRRRAPRPQLAPMSLRQRLGAALIAFGRSVSGSGEEPSVTPCPGAGTG